ncbi:hypothetical protein K7432_010901 [Basidiobolus ranarum]|uniref:Uncharacterized protein n=1 Tax=Basidiobolus ranarum TaxID=34480 RepID=A0ABR2WN36_9FUNG
MNSTRLLLCSLEEAIVNVIVVQRAPSSTTNEDCLIIVGRKGTLRVLTTEITESGLNQPLSKVYHVPSPVLSVSELKETFALNLQNGPLIVVDMWKSVDSKSSLPTLLSLSRPKLPILSIASFINVKGDIQLVAMTPRNKLLNYRWEGNNESQITYSPEHLRMQIKDTLELIASHSSEKQKLEKRVEETSKAIWQNNLLLHELEKISEKRQVVGSSMGLTLIPTVIPTFRDGSLQSLPYLKVSLNVNDSTLRTGWKLNVKLSLDQRKHHNPSSTRYAYEAELNTRAWERLIPIPMRYDLFPLRVEVGLRSCGYTSDQSNFKHHQNSAVYIFLEMFTFDIIDFAAPDDPEISFTSTHTHSSPHSLNFDRQSGLVKHIAEIFNSSVEKKYSSSRDGVGTSELRLFFKNTSNSEVEFNIYKSFFPIFLGENIERTRLEKILVDASTATFYVPFNPNLVTLLLSQGSETTSEGHYLDLNFRSTEKALGLQVEEAILERIRAFALDTKPKMIKIAPSRIQELNEIQYKLETHWQLINSWKNKYHIPWNQWLEKILDFELVYFEWIRTLQSLESNVITSVLL